MKKIQVDEMFDKSNISGYDNNGPDIMGRTIEIITNSNQVITGKCMGYWFDTKKRCKGFFLDTEKRDVYSGAVEFQSILWKDVLILDSWLDYEQTHEFGIPDLPSNKEDLLLLAKKIGRFPIDKTEIRYEYPFPLLPYEKEKILKWACFLMELGFEPDGIGDAGLIENTDTFFSVFFEPRIEYGGKDETGIGSMYLDSQGHASVSNFCNTDRNKDPNGIVYPINVGSDFSGTWEEVLRKVLEHEIFIINKKKEMGIE